MALMTTERIWDHVTKSRLSWRLGIIWEDQRVSMSSAERSINDSREGRSSRTRKLSVRNGKFYRLLILLKRDSYMPVISLLLQPDHDLNFVRLAFSRSTYALTLSPERSRLWQQPRSRQRSYLHSAFLNSISDMISPVTKITITSPHQNVALIEDLESLAKHKPQRRTASTHFDLKLRTYVPFFRER